MPTQQINQYEQVMDENAYNIVPSISSSNLVVALKRSDGTNDPSDNYPISIQVGTTVLRVTTALSVTVPAAAGDIFSWDAGKIQTNDSQLFVYLINNNGTPILGVSPCPTLTTVATNYYDGSQTGAAGHTNIVIGSTRNAINSCTIIGRINVNQLDNNNWQSPIAAKIINYPVWHTDFLIWTPTLSGFGSMTYTSTTIYQALYQITQASLYVTIDFDGTTGGTPSAALQATLPIVLNYAAATYRVPLVGQVTDTALAAGNVYAVSTNTNTLFFAKSDFSNFGLGAGRRGTGSGNYKIS